MKTKVLLVDDEKAYIDPLSERLKARGFDVFLAYDGERALELVESHDFDVVLLDVMMPGKGGLETLADIQKLDFMVHIILLTGHAEIDTAIAEVRTGAFDYLVKPIQLESLIERIQLAHQHKMMREERFQKEWATTDQQNKKQ